MADTEDILVKRLSSDAIAALEPARRVLETEISGLQDLSRALDDRFTQALAVLDNVQGRVIVTGMGKSGHIARKMAATLASTGTPAQYVHPGEASHGDLGMITTDDAVIERAIDATTDAGVPLSCNLTGSIWVNQSAAFSDFHVTGANPSGNATLCDGAFVCGRFRTVYSRVPVPTPEAVAT